MRQRDGQTDRQTDRQSETDRQTTEAALAGDAFVEEEEEEVAEDF